MDRYGDEVIDFCWGDIIVYRTGNGAIQRFPRMSKEGQDALRRLYERAPRADVSYMDGNPSCFDSSDLPPCNGW